MAQHHERSNDMNNNDRYAYSKHTKSVVITTMTSTTMSFNYCLSESSSFYSRRDSALNEIAVKPLTHFPDISSFIDDDHHYEEEKKKTTDESGRLSTEGHLQRLRAKSTSPGPVRVPGSHNRTSLPHPSSRTTCSSCPVQESCHVTRSESSNSTSSNSTSDSKQGCQSSQHEALSSLLPDAPLLVSSKDSHPSSSSLDPPKLLISTHFLSSQVCKECSCLSSSIPHSVTTTSSTTSHHPLQQKLSSSTKSPTKCVSCSRPLLGRRHTSSKREEGPTTNITSTISSTTGIPSSCLISGASSNRTSDHPVIDPRSCPIISGKETLIELINRSKVGLGWSIVGGSDTPFVSLWLQEVILSPSSCVVFTISFLRSLRLRHRLKLTKTSLDSCS